MFFLLDFNIAFYVLSHKIWDTSFYLLSLFSGKALKAQSNLFGCSDLCCLDSIDRSIDQERERERGREKE